ncbi:ABC transporter ATP-binding protein [Streptomyces sp. 6N223]|uniref:ABC transporter ATP-binding protein n=1 Tax=Streptomyces sp. 6N223 TaxID=3457412 RepID=UPI003FD31D3A
MTTGIGTDTGIGTGTGTGTGAGPDLLPVARARRVRAAVRELLRAHRGLALAAFATMTAATTVGLLIQPLLGHIVDLVADRRGADALALPVTLLAAVALAQGLATAFGLSLVSRLGETLLAGVRERFVERALRLPLSRVEKAGSGDLTSRVTDDVVVVAQAVRNALPELVRSLLAIALTLAALAVLDWRFLLAALLAVPLQAHTARWYLRRAVPLYAAERVASGARQQQLLDTIGGAATVRAFRLQRPHTALVSDRSGEAMSVTLRGVRLVLRFYCRLHLAEYIGLAAVLVTGFLLVREGAVSIGTATAAALYFHSLFTPVNAALVLMDDAQKARAGLARMIGVADLDLDLDPSTRPRRDPETDPETDPGTVTITGLTYAYAPGRPVLHGIDLTLLPKERVALVGASGAGKTTLAKLVAGIHRPDTGTVRTGGAVGLVTQEIHVFAGPLADDLLLARPGASDAELREALDRVGALAWAEALPDGLHTVVGEGGHRLSATQAQQLALARLVLADPPIAVLDEATAEAGSAGAALLERAAERALDGRTALIVAHRLTQARGADRIVVLDGGRVAECGTHDELVAADGAYAALWRAWSSTRPSTSFSSSRPSPAPLT